MYYYVLFLVILVSGCNPSIDHSNEFTPHRLNATMYKVTEIEQFTKRTIRELDKYSSKEGLSFKVISGENRFEPTTYRSETPKNLAVTFESLLTEILDGTSHYQSIDNAVCNQNKSRENIQKEMENISENNPSLPTLESSPSTTVDMLIRGEYSWYEKDTKNQWYTVSPIFTGPSTNIDTTLGNYESTSQGEVIVTIENCQKKRIFSTRERVDIFERSSDNSIYLFSKNFGIVWISKGKKRGSVNVAMQEAAKLAILKAILLATGKSLIDIEKIVNLPKIIRESMDTSDQKLLSETLERNRDNKFGKWHNPRTGNQYTINPMQKYHTSNKQLCREFWIEAEIEGIEGKVIENGYIIACKE